MKYTTGILGLAVIAFSLSPLTADAGWGALGGGSSGVYAGGSSGGYASGGSSGAYSAAYASGGSSGYTAAYASYGSSGRPGILARLRSHLAAKHARHAARRAAYASGGSSGAYAGSSGYTYRAAYGSSGSYARGSSGGSSGHTVRYSSGGSTGSYATPSTSYGSSGGGSVYYGVSNQSPSAVSSLVSNVAGDEVYLTVSVPSEAKVFVNGKETKSTGAVRQFVSRGLEANKQYRFEIRAEIPSVDGEKMVEERELMVSAGDAENLAFAFADYDKAIETALTLSVPEGATVTLAGNQTRAVGDQRTYRTSQLKPGQIWDDYEVEVKLGDEVKRQSIRLIAGDRLQLSFNFDESESMAAGKLASR
ncbi:MAG: TIGR03000 domain-containing protein [Pirellulaceae bacterium]